MQLSERMCHSAGGNAGLPIVCRRAEASGEMLAAAARYEARFGIRFETLTLFTKDLLRELHEAPGDGAELPADVLIASRSDASILARIEALGEVANASAIGPGQRESYYTALQEIYRALPAKPGWALHDPSVLYLAPEREGRILAEALAWLPRGHALHPHAKRIPFAEGLLIGLSKLAGDSSCSTAVLIDGAIASGATLITLMESLRSAISEFYIYSVHCAPEGARAILRYGEWADLDIHMVVGHCSGELNRKFYAIDPEETDRVIVGDLGDIISELAAKRPPE
jgi:hypothetical protein